MTTDPGSLPRLPLALLRALLPRAERDEILADLAAEYHDRRRTQGAASAGRWFRRQAIGSAGRLVGWSWHRTWSGYQSPANAYQRGGRRMQNWLTDARYAVRRLRSRPGYTALAVLTLALGIGGTAAVFGIARPLLFDPLPYPNADQVVAFWRAGWWTEQEFLFLRDKFSGFRAVAAHRPWDVTMRVGDGPARLIPGIATSAELFDVLGAQPILGRTFRPGDDVRGAEPVAVISYGLWQELGGDRSVVGSRLVLDGSPRTVIGVMPRGFWYPSPVTRIWTSRELDPEGRNGSYEFVGRVATGQDVRRMDAHLDLMTRAIGERFQYAERADKTVGAFVTPLRDKLLGSMRPAVVATMAGMVLILLIACVNVAALMLGQVEGRSTELAVRSALGATRGRITQQLVIEALLVGVLAAVVGGGLATAGFGLLAGALPIGAWSDAATFDWTLFAVALAVSIVAALLVVLVPTVSLWRGDLRGRMGSARTGLSPRGGRLERGLVVAEVALAMLIASGTALLVRSVTKLYAIDPGVRTEGVAVVDFLSSSGMNMGQRIQTIERLIEGLSAIPGVRSVAATMKVPLRGGGDSFDITVEGRPEIKENYTYFRIVTPPYFETMGIKLVAGRTFDASDLTAALDTSRREMPVVINQALAAQYFPGVDPIGRRLGGGFGTPQRVIGVVSDVAEGSLTDKPEPTRYYFHRQAWFGWAGALMLELSRPSGAAPVLEEARRTVERIAPEFALQGTTTMARVFDDAVGPARQMMVLLGILSGMALVLGAIGIYGVIAHFAARRRRDWAIRVALGLPGSRVISHIVGQGAGLALAGIAIGAVAAGVLARLLTSLLYGVRSVDPLAFAAASGVLLLIAVAAAFVPARRAGTVDPATVLRDQ